MGKVGPCESVVFEDEKSEECKVAPLKKASLAFDSFQRQKRQSEFDLTYESPPLEIPQYTQDDKEDYGANVERDSCLKTDD